MDEDLMNDLKNDGYIYGGDQNAVKSVLVSDDAFDICRRKGYAFDSDDNFNLQLSYLTRNKLSE